MAKAKPPLKVKVKTPEAFTVSTRFGDIALSADRLVNFPHGIFGFADCTQFGLAAVPNQPQSPMLLLHCTGLRDKKEKAPEDITFIVAAPENLGVTFQAGDIAEAIAENSLSATDTQVLLILTIYPTPEGFSITANLRAPLLIDTSSHTGVQHILANNDYGTQHKVA